MVVLLVANVANTVAEFSGAAAALEIFGVSRYLVVPIVAVSIWALVIKASYRTVERVFLSVIVVFGAYIVSAVLAIPTGRASVAPSSRRLSISRRAELLLLVAVVGTTITPYMQFYLTSAVAEKGIGVDELRLEQADAIGGSIWTNVIAIFIVVAAAATIGVAGGAITSAADAARALEPVAGRLAEALFAVGLFGASVLADDHAAVDGVRHLRGVRLGVGRRQAVRRRALVLLDLHVRAGGRGGRRAHPGARPVAAASRRRTSRDSCRQSCSCSWSCS